MRILVVPALLLLAMSGVAAEPPGEKAAKWEYAELSYRNIPGRTAVKNQDGTEIPATPPYVSLKWLTGIEEVAYKGWDEMGEKLKAQVKKDGSASLQRLQVMNALGTEGWELVSQQSTTSTTVTAADRSGRGFAPGAGADRSTRSSTNSTLLFKRRVR